MMPNTDGLRALDRVARRRRRHSGDLRDRARQRGGPVVGLSKLGADDYLAKPFDPRELLARIDTVLRRRGPSATSEPEAREP